jgi:hypothetical protein
MGKLFFEFIAFPVGKGQKNIEIYLHSIQFYNFMEILTKRVNIVSAEHSYLLLFILYRPVNVNRINWCESSVLFERSKT